MQAVFFGKIPLFERKQNSKLQILKDFQAKVCPLHLSWIEGRQLPTHEWRCHRPLVKVDWSWRVRRGNALCICVWISLNHSCNGDVLGTEAHHSQTRSWITTPTSSLSFQRCGVAGLLACRSPRWWHYVVPWRWHLNCSSLFSGMLGVILCQFVSSCIIRKGDCSLNGLALRSPDWTPISIVSFGGPGGHNLAS